MNHKIVDALLALAFLVVFLGEYAGFELEALGLVFWGAHGLLHIAVFTALVWHVLRERINGKH